MALLILRSLPSDGGGKLFMINDHGPQYSTLRGLSAA
jgi:hypothetical protein